MAGGQTVRIGNCCDDKRREKTMGKDSQTSLHPRSTAHYVKALIGVLIIILFWFLPPFGQMTQVGMAVLGIFVAVLYLYTLDEIQWASVLCFIAMAFAVPELYPDYTGVGLYKVIELSIGNWLVTFIIANLLMAYALNETGFVKRVTYWFLRRKIAQRSPWGFTLLFFVAALFVGCWLDTVTTFVFFAGFAHTLLEQMGFKRGESYPCLLIMGLAFSVNIAFAMTPISHGSIITGMGMIQGMTGAPINIVSYMLVGVPVGVVCFAGMYLVLRYGYKADMSQFQNVDILALVGEKAEPMSKREKATTAIFAAVVICWLAAGFLNIFAPESGAAGFFNQISLIMPALAGVAAMLVLRVDGRPLLDFEKACRGGVTWSIILLIATVMMLGTVLSESTTGFTATVGEILQVLLSGGLSAFLVLFLIAAVIIVLTNFFNNVPVMILFLTVCVPLADSIGTTGLAVGTIILIAAEMAFATPAAFATIAMIYADDYVQPKRVLKYGMIVMVWTVLAVGLLAYPLASIVF